MKRNLNIEMIRALAIIYMLLYHFMVSMPEINAGAEQAVIIESFGQFALIGFFVLSGYGTFCLFSKMEKVGEVSFNKYVKRRLFSILPQYYLCILFLLLTTWRTSLWSREGCVKIVESFLLLQNFDNSNGVNGVTWTIAVLFQLYLIAIPLYKLLRKYRVGIWFVIAIIMFALRRGIFWYIGTNGIDAVYYVITSIRIPFTTVDLFFTGMCAAYISEKINEKIKTKNRILIAAFVGMLVVYHIGFVKYATITGGLWGNKWTACIWQIMVAVWVAIILLLASKMKFEYRSYLGRGIQFVARYEYGIYLWHMILFQAFSTSGVNWWIQLSEAAPFCLVMIMIMVSVLVGYLSMIVASGDKYLKIYSFLKKG